MCTPRPQGGPASGRPSVTPRAHVWELPGQPHLIGSRLGRASEPFALWPETPHHLLPPGPRTQTHNLQSQPSFLAHRSGQFRSRLEPCPGSLVLGRQSQALVSGLPPQNPGPMRKAGAHERRGLQVRVQQSWLVVPPPAPRKPAAGSVQLLGGSCTWFELDPGLVPSLPLAKGCGCSPAQKQSPVRETWGPGTPSAADLMSCELLCGRNVLLRPPTLASWKGKGHSKSHSPMDAAGRNPLPGGEGGQLAVPQTHPPRSAMVTGLPNVSWPHGCPE